MSTLHDKTVSLEYRLWAILRQMGWTHQVNGVPLARVDETTYQVDGGLPWCFLDEEGQPTRDDVVVYDGGNIVDPTAYTVDFINTRIVFATPPAGPVTADLRHFTVRVRRGWPEEQTLEMADLPLVAYHVLRQRSRPMGIGTSALFKRPMVELLILGRTENQRNALLDQMQDMLVRIPIFEMGQTQMLNDDGDINTDFNYEEQYQGPARITQAPQGSILNPTPSGSHKHRWRALVTVEFEKI